MHKNQRRNTDVTVPGTNTTIIKHRGRWKNIKRTLHHKNDFAQKLKVFGSPFYFHNLLFFPHTNIRGVTMNRRIVLRSNQVDLS